MPDPNILANGAWYGGSPYLGPNATVRAVGPTGTTPPSGTVANPPTEEAAFAYMWHSHNEREITTNNIFPGGMMMMMLVDSREFQLLTSRINSRRRAMRSNYLKTLKTAVLAISVLLLGVSVSVAQQQINLTAGPTAITLSDGTSVPMWGYTCGAVVSGSTATCAKSNPAVTGWSPVVITVPTGQGLQINLTNNLSFANGNSVPTSLTIVGQLGGGLGSPQGTTAAPDHTNAQVTTWPVADPTPVGTPPTQGPRARSFGTEVLAGATGALSWSSANLKPGTYLLESGTHPSIQGPMGLYGVVIVTDAVTKTAYPGVTYNADIPMVLSEIDPVQNRSVDAAVNTLGFDEANVWSGQPGKCGNPTSANYNTCYPPAVNYSPVYYLINGVAFSRASASASLFPTTPATGVAGNVLVRLVNAGLRMHVPSIVGAQTGAGAAGFALIAEDGNPLPGVPRIQNEVFLAAGKTYDVMITAPASGTALPIFDRQLSLSGNATARDAGMLAYISVNGAGLPSAPVLGAAVANPDPYTSVINGQTLIVSDPVEGRDRERRKRQRRESGPRFGDRRNPYPEHQRYVHLCCHCGLWFIPVLR